jgi:uncharacterized protein (TIGR02246 family)
MSDNSIGALYQELLDAWNARDAARFAALFAADGHVVGFDGSQVDGRAAIESSMRQIFDNHKTGTYVSLVREERPLGADAAILRGVAGMTPAGAHDLKPELNAIQTLIAVRQDEGWWIVMFQNTPAAFHGRPEDVTRLTDELRASRS